MLVGVPARRARDASTNFWETWTNVFYRPLKATNGFLNVGGRGARRARVAPTIFGGSHTKFIHEPLRDNIWNHESGLRVGSRTRPAANFCGSQSKFIYGPLRENIWIPEFGWAVAVARARDCPPFFGGSRTSSATNP